MDVESRRELIGYLRLARAFQLMGIAIEAVVIWVDARLHLYAYAASAVVMIPFFAVLMVVTTRIIRRGRAQLRRPDYGQIASMERALFGRMFDHAR